VPDDPVPDDPVPDDPATPTRPTGWIGGPGAPPDAADGGDSEVAGAFTGMGQVRPEPASGASSDVTGDVRRSDVPALIRAALAEAASDRDKRQLHLGGAVAAADALAATSLGAAVLARVAEAVRLAGVAEIAALPRPLPDPAQARLLRHYLSAAAEAPPHPARDTAFARWLGVVCVHLAIRRIAQIYPVS
jgi:hypothetical protein